MSDKNSILYNHLQQLRKWQEEQCLKLQQQQAEQLQYVGEEQEKIQRLIKSKESFVSESSQLISGPNTITSDDTCPFDNLEIENQICPLLDPHKSDINNFSATASVNENRITDNNTITQPIENTKLFSADKNSKENTVKEEIDQKKLKPKFNNFTELIESELQKFSKIPLNTDSKRPKHKFLKKGEGIIKRFYKKKNCKDNKDDITSSNYECDNLKLDAKSSSQYSCNVVFPSKLNEVTCETNANNLADKLSSTSIAKELILNQYNDPIECNDDQIFDSTLESDTTILTEFSLGVKKEAVELHEFILLEAAAKSGSHNNGDSLVNHINTSTPEKSQYAHTEEIPNSVLRSMNAQEEIKVSDFDEPNQVDSHSQHCDDTDLRFKKMNGVEISRNMEETDKHIFPDHDIPCQTENKLLEILSEQSYEFNDECSWNEDTSMSDSIGQLSRPYDFSKYIETSEPSAHQRTPSPFEKLGYVASIFDNTKNQDKNPRILQNSSSEVHCTNISEMKNLNKSSYENNSPLQNNQAKLLTDKLHELESEINIFKSENNKLRELKKVKTEELQQLISSQKKSKEFHEKKFNAMKKDLDEEKHNLSQERQKLNKEKQIFYQAQKSRKTKVTKCDVNEVQQLQAQVGKLQIELNTNEKQWSSKVTRYKKRIDVLVSSDKDLKSEIQSFQKQCKELYDKLQKKERQLSDAMRTNKRLMFSNAKNECQEFPKKADENSNAGKTSEENTIDEKKKLNGNNDEKVASAVHNWDENDCTMKKFEDKIVRTFKDGRNEIEFLNNTKKEIFPDGSQTIYYYNGDVRKVLVDNSVVYYYAGAKITQSTFPDGMEIIEFPNKQIEKMFPGGMKHVTYPDGTSKCIFPDGSEESVASDGTIVKIDADGKETIKFPNGQTEIHTNEFRRREYPDGTRKTLYSDGRQETQYSNGRIRIKDSNGKVIVDSMS
ncbi:Centromere protein J [Nymphon striatum]|nr:Centromere protein J [Nymphon striatum]